MRSGRRLRYSDKERERKRSREQAGGSASSGPMASSSPPDPDSRLAAPAAAAAAGMVSDTLPAGPMPDGEGYTPPNGGGAAAAAPVVTTRSSRSHSRKQKRPTPMDSPNLTLIRRRIRTQFGRKWGIRPGSKRTASASIHRPPALAIDTMPTA